MTKISFQNVEFILSAADKKKFRQDYPAVVFIGRSNVGKSTLINGLVRRGQFMKTSKTPGCTYLVNYALVDHAFYLCDAPGYGYAKLFSRDTFAPLMKAFLEENPALKKVYILIDSRRLLLPADDSFADYLESLELPYSFIFTKCDKLKKAEKDALEEQIQKVLPTASFRVGIRDDRSYEAVRQDIIKTCLKK